MDRLDVEDRHGFSRIGMIKSRWSSGSSLPRTEGFPSSLCLSSGSVLKVEIGVLIFYIL